jgi:hypothetical protein
MRSAMSNTSAKTFNLSTLSNPLNSCSNRFSPLTNLFKDNLKSLVPYRFTLKKGEVFRVPSECKELQVLSGVAWITLGGQDIILSSGQTASLESNKGFAILSVLGKAPLTLEVRIGSEH